MASLVAHVVPGLVLAFYGLCWCINSIWLYLRTRQQISSGSKPKDTTNCPRYYKDRALEKKSWIPTTCMSRLPIESVCKILVSSMGISEEVFLGFDQNRHLMLMFYTPILKDGTMNSQSKFFHITMYSLFLLSGFIDLLTLCLKLPKYTSMIAFSAAFYFEGLLFYFHILDGRGTLNSTTHLLLVYSIASCVIFSLLRMYSPNNLLINLGLSSSLLIQGTWLVQIGYFVFGGYTRHLHDGTPRDHYILFSVAIYVWHVVAVIVFNLIILGMLTVLMNWVDNRTFYGRKTRYETRLSGGWKNLPKEEKNRLINIEEDERSEDYKPELHKVDDSLV